MTTREPSTDEVGEDNSTKCLIPECDRKAQWKGLCGKCYHQAKKLIENKEVADWDELAKLGLCDEPVPFLKAFKAAKARASSTVETTFVPPSTEVANRG